MEEKSTKDVFDEMEGKWPSAIVERGHVKQFTGGLISGKTLANADSKGEGPLEKIKQGRNRVAYPLRALIPWLRGRCSITNTNAAAQGGNPDGADEHGVHSEA